MKQQVEKLICEHFGVTRNDLHSHRRTANLAWARQVAYWMFREILAMSGPGIAEYFDRSDWAGIYHGLRQVENRMQCYPAIQLELSSLRASILATITSTSGNTLKRELQLPP